MANNRKASITLIFKNMFFIFWPCHMQGPNFPIRNAPCIDSTESYPLSCQGSPSLTLIYTIRNFIISCKKKQGRLPHSISGLTVGIFLGSGYQQGDCTNTKPHIQKKSGSVSSCISFLTMKNSFPSALSYMGCESEHEIYIQTDCVRITMLLLSSFIT